MFLHRKLNGFEFTSIDSAYIHATIDLSLLTPSPCKWTFTMLKLFSITTWILNTNRYMLYTMFTNLFQIILSLWKKNHSSHHPIQFPYKTHSIWNLQPISCLSSHCKTLRHIAVLKWRRAHRHWIRLSESPCSRTGETASGSLHTVTWHGKPKDMRL